MSDYKELVEKLRDADQANWKRLSLDAAAAIEALQADVKRLKECNDELREAQTYIDHYGDKWLTSAKDVPTAAYNHGYMDGKYEAQPHWVSVEDGLPEPHKDVLVTGMEAINNHRVYKVMVNDNGTWRPTDYAPSILWDYWMPIEPPQEVQDA